MAMGNADEGFSEMHKEQVHGGLKLRAKLANASTEEKASELKSDYGWQVARTERSQKQFLRGH